MKKILVIFNSQTGQGKNIIEQIFEDVKDQVQIDYAEIKLTKPFPFPWTSERFFDAMPECVLQVPSPIEAMNIDLQKDYDLIVYGYQPWFLSQSIPSNSFMKSQYAKALQGKPVITIIGCRNMWLHAQETVKSVLKDLQAHHVGHIVFQDNHSNLTSLRTTMRWLFKGQKEADNKLPEAGVAKEDIVNAKRFGPIILQHLTEGNLSALQTNLIQHNAVKINNGLLLLEGRGVSQFPLWAKKAVAAKSPEDRAKIIKKFSRLLIANIFVLSHIANVGAALIAKIKRKSVAKKAAYFRSVEYKEGML